MSSASGSCTATIADVQFGCHLMVDLYRFATLELTEDKAEGHQAWREKRKPAFRGR